MAENDNELNDLFSSATASGGPIEADVLAELQSIMRLHSIPPQELFYKWESYSIKMGQDDMKLDIDTVRALKQNVQDGLEKENRKTKAHISNKRVGATPRNAVNNNDVFGMLDITPNTPRSGMSSRPKRKPETPSISRVKAEPASSPPDFKTSNNLKEISTGAVTGSPYAPTPFNDRPHAGQTVEVLNDHLEVPEPPIAPYSESRIKLTANSDMKKLSYKTMAMKSSEASEILDDRIDEFMLLIQAHHKLEDSDFGSAASQSTNEIVAVGRIACDSAEGKLNPSSIVLETSRRMGAGLRIPLKIDKMRGFQFFPGQIVALKGINASGEDFTVSEILEPPLLGVAASTPNGLDEHVRRLRGGPDAMDEDSDPAPLNIIIGSGPFTADDNLDFEPLHAICSQAADTYADVLILTGPFLDIDHPLIASGDFDLPEEVLSDPDSATMSAIFKHLITPAFTQLTSTHPRITILLIPSVKDAINKHAAWPQEPFPKKDLGLPKAVRIVGNPMTIALNEIVMGISSQDILYELRHEEIIGGNPQDSTLLARLPKYLIEQRHFFPLFPPVQRTQLPKTGTEDGIPVGAMLDTSFLKLGEMINVRPDMLVVPSSLPPFAKVVESVLVINPGYLSKRRAAGTYAKLTVYPASMTEQERTQGTMIGHKLFERARVDIVRI
ncbi:DNA-directed DNA polymerase alpha subunit pol12 [Ciborinia camelliae]|nr:DNA-directed DNA polymerase alpha subunit pol12 [Ciborinia camelliae]